MLEQDYPYQFETQGGSSLRASSAADAYLQALEARLGFGRISAIVFENALRDFVINCHLSIAWYQKRINRELRWRQFYFCLSLAILVALPIGLMALPTLLSASPHFLPSWLVGSAPVAPAVPPTAAAAPAGTTTSQIGALLTGLLAFYRGISAWLDKRQVVAGYAKAMSDLKELLYTFEQKWDGVATEPSHELEFRQAIKEATAKSRTIVRLETEQYFSTLSYPTLDLADILKSSGSQVQDLMKQFMPALPTSATAPGAVPAPDPLVAQLRAKVDEYDAELRNLGPGTSPQAIANLRRLRDQAVDQLRAAQLASMPPPRAA